MLDSNLSGGQKRDSSCLIMLLCNGCVCQQVHPISTNGDHVSVVFTAVAEKFSFCRFKMNLNRTESGAFEAKWHCPPPPPGKSFSTSSCFRCCSTTVTIWSFSSPSVIFDNCSVLRCDASGPSVSLRSPLQLTDLTVRPDSRVRPHRIEHQTRAEASAMRSGAHLGIRATPQLSPTLMNYTCLASHLPRSSLCNVSHAWRIVCVCECLCGCIYIQTGIEGTVTHSLCSLFLPHNLPTHPSPISKKKKQKSISLDISQLYNVVIIISLHLLNTNRRLCFQNDEINIKR